MVDIDIVIGSNYGDEGKGLATDFLCRYRQYKKCCNVLFNGGCQRGHTISLKLDYKSEERIIFQHFGSASVDGASTYYAKEFLLNPMMWVQERNKLMHRNISRMNLESFRDPECRLQLPIDVFLNRLLETSRHANKNGSVGIGIWETILRYRNDKSSLNFEDFCKTLTPLSRNEQITYIKKLQEHIVEERLKTLDESENIDIDLYDMFMNDKQSFNVLSVDKDGSTYEIFMSDGMIDHFINDLFLMHNECKSIPFDEIIENYEHIIFEQGQGLLIGKDYPNVDFKYATPSSTGSCDIAEYIVKYCKNNIKQINLDYVSRTYLTRHGNGPFPEEDKTLMFPDETNMPNEWQGSIRFGNLNYDELFARIDYDFNRFKQMFENNVKVVKNIMMTHANEITVPLDILKDKVSFISNDKYSFSDVNIIKAFSLFFD